MPTVSFTDFSGGLWISGTSESGEQEANFAVPENALVRADNIEFLPSGAVRGRRGSSKFNSEALAGPVVALARLYPRASLEEKVENGGSCENVLTATAGNVSWKTPEGADSLSTSAPSLRATCLLDYSGDDSESHWLFCRGPFAGLNVPPDATIDGIEVSIIRSQYAAYVDIIKDLNVQLTGDGGLTWPGSNEAGSDYWPIYGREAEATYGGPNEKWGWLAADLKTVINTDSFGVGIRVKNDNGVGGGAASQVAVAMINYIRVRAFFSFDPGYPKKRFVEAHTWGVNNANLGYGQRADDDTAGTFDDISVSDTNGDPLTLFASTWKPRIVYWPEKGKIFMFDGTNPMLEWAGGDTAGAVNPVTEVPTGSDLESIAPRKGPFACLHQSRLWATDPSELQYSVYASKVNDEQTWYPDVHLGVNDEGGGEITGLASLGEILVILKSTSVFTFIGNADGIGGQPLGVLRQVSTRGCVAPDSVQVTPYGVIFVGREGVYITNGSEVESVSDAIKPLFVGRTADNVYTTAVGLYYPKRDQYWLKLDPDADEGYVLHRVSSGYAWTRIPALPMTCGTVFAGDEGQMYVGDSNGYIWLRDTGASSEADPIVPYVTTRSVWLDPNDRRMGRAFHLRPLFRGIGTLTVGLRYDHLELDEADNLSVQFTSSGGAEGAFTEPRAYISDKAEFGRFLAIAMSITEGASLEVHRVDVDVQMRGYKPWR